MGNLNVLKYSYLKGVRQIPGNIRQFFRNIKYAYQRATKGYCDADLWDLDTYYSELFYQTLREFADTTLSYPGKDEFSGGNEGYEAWQRYLKEMAEHFLNTQKWNDEILINKQINEAFEKMNSHIISREEQKEMDDLTPVFSFKDYYDDEEAYNKAREDWLKLEFEAKNFREEEKDKAFDMMKKYFFDLWD